MFCIIDDNQTFCYRFIKRPKNKTRLKQNHVLNYISKSKLRAIQRMKLELE